jgi:hypothetical protein
MEHGAATQQDETSRLRSRARRRGGNPDLAGGCVLKQEVGRFPTREQAEWRASELHEWAERNPRGYVQYLVRPVEETRED